MRVHYLHNRYAGAVLWLLSIQYYVAQVAAAASWSKVNSYSWVHNSISDLANTHCGFYGGRLVCSPLHTVMNSSFIALGITMTSGAFLLRKQLSVSQVSNFGFDCMALAGGGTILVGLFPENSIGMLHIIGAALTFIFGNLGMILLGIGLVRQSVLFRGFTIISGVTGLLALVFFITNNYAGIGIGGMERLVAYPQSIWMICYGTYVLLAAKDNT